MMGAQRVPLQSWSPSPSLATAWRGEVLAPNIGHGIRPTTTVCRHAAVPRRASAGHQDSLAEPSRLLIVWRTASGVSMLQAKCTPRTPALGLVGLRAGRGGPVMGGRLEEDRM